MPGAVIAIQTFGDVLGFNPHCHILVTDGCFYANGMFRVAPLLELKKLEAIFRHKVFCMLIARGKISLLSTGRHSGVKGRIHAGLTCGKNRVRTTVNPGQWLRRLASLFGYSPQKVREMLHWRYGL